MLVGVLPSEPDVEEPSRLRHRQYELIIGTLDSVKSGAVLTQCVTRVVSRALINGPSTPEKQAGFRLGGHVPACSLA